MTIAVDPGADPDHELTLDEIRALTDTESIHALLKQLNQHEQRVDHELDELLGDRERLQDTMASLARL
jgi:DNA-binding transcriptional MerR regulator